MAREQQTREETRRSAVSRLAWRGARRDDRVVAQAIQAGEEIDAVYTLDEAGLLDAFYHVLGQVGVLDLSAGVGLPGVRRVLVPVVQFVLLYLLKTLYGIASMSALPPLLFSNVALMRVSGFNAHQVGHGLTRRGEARRRLRPKRGPLSPPCLAENICKLGAEQRAALFNGTVRLPVVRGLVRGHLTVALDGSTVRTPQSYPGRGCLSVTRTATEAKTKRRVTIVETVFGWKVRVLIDVQTRRPVARAVGQIQDYEGQWLLPRLLPLVRQAQETLGTVARITTVVIDRGYLDGADLWTLDPMDLTVVIVAKDTRAVTADARRLAVAGAGHARERVEVIRHRHGRTATTEQRRPRLVGVEALTTYATYGDAEHARGRTRTDVDGHPLTAVVVLRWGGRTFPDGGTVYLTNGPVRDPFVAFDTDDWRSVIKNGLFTEGKQPWHLEHVPQRTEAAVRVQCYVTLMVMALCTAFRLCQEAAETTATAADGAAPTLTSALLGGGRRRDRMLAPPPQRGEPRQDHRLQRPALWHLPRRRVRRPRRPPPQEHPADRWHPVRDPRPLRPWPLTLISKHQSKQGRRGPVPRRRGPVPRCVCLTV